MSPLGLQPTPDSLQVQLPAMVTIQEARALHTALLAALQPAQHLVIEAAAVTRVDAAGLQVLLAAARQARGSALTAPSQAWTDACARLGFTDSFFQPRTIPAP